MTYKAEPIGEVKDLGTVYQAIAPLSQQILALKKQGIEHPYLVTPEETAMIRIAGLSNDGTRTCIAPVAVKGENPILYKTSLFMDPLIAVIAEQAHRNNQYPTLPREFYKVLSEEAKKQESLEPEDRTAHRLSSKEDYDLTSEMDDSKFVLGKPTAEYFRKFNHPKIRLFNLPTTDLPKKNQCAVNYLWFDWPENVSCLSCRDRDLDSDGGAFGVLKKSAEGASQDFNYSLTNVRDSITGVIPKFLEEVGLTAIRDIISGKLEQRVLENLRNQ